MSTEIEELIARAEALAEALEAAEKRIEELLAELARREPTAMDEGVFV